MKATDIKGQAVVPEGSTSATGNVVDLILDMGECRMVALLVRSDSGDEYVLPVDDIRTVRDTGVSAARDAAILPLADAPGYTSYPTFDRIFNQDAVTQSGRNLGKLVDLEIDDASWNIREYDVVDNYAEAFVRGPRRIPASRVEAGARMLMVQDVEANSAG